MTQTQRHKAELAKRRKVKKALIERCPEDKIGRKLCPRCGKLPDPIRGLQLSHKIPLARGGKTNMTNCEILCGKCHASDEHLTENQPKSQPVDHGMMPAMGFRGLRPFSKDLQIGRKK